MTLEETQLSALGGRFGTTSTKTIAGRRARCVTFAASDLVQTGDETTTAGPVTVKGSYSYCIDAHDRRDAAGVHRRDRDCRLP